MFKNIFFISGVLFLALIAGGCQKDLLNPVPQSVLATTNFYKTANDMNLAVLGIYDRLQSIKSSCFRYMELPSDNIYLGPWVETPGTIELENLGVTSANNEIADFYEASYNGIFRANCVLANVDKPTNYKTAQKEQFIGEAKFLRALFYFDMVRLFGGVPKITTLLSIEEGRNTPRASEAEIYDLIVEDLKDAIDKLPAKENIAKGRASKGSAVALLSKVYVYRKDWNNAKTYLEQLFNNYNYSLVPNFANVIKTEDNSELIFVVKYIDNTDGQGFSQAYCPYSGIYQVLSGGGNMNPCWSLHKLFLSDDTRKVTSITEMWKSWVATASTPAIWAPYASKLIPSSITYGVNSGLDLPILRLADMVLLYAETLYELQQPQQALVQLNKIRERAFLGTSHNYTITDVPDHDTFMDKLLMERRLELAFENDRWCDLLRTGKFVTVMVQHETQYNNVTPATVVTLNPKQYMRYFPIPQRQIDQSASGVLVQNDGY
jgi:starch-binding outer membrane protein, SusD/RagB family